VSLIRALFAWIVVFAVLLVLTSMLGMISRYEVAIVFVVSIVLTWLLIRFWDRRHAAGAGDTTSS
jgi:positive regulator of sigma E activity